MSGLEWFKEINNTLGVIAWPSVVLIVVYWFRGVLAGLVERVSLFEGRIGENQLKVEVQKIVTTNVSKAAELESQGKRAEAERVTSDTARIVAELHGLSRRDLDYLVSLASGGSPRRRWGPIHLVRAGLLELDGGNLTEDGVSLVQRYQNLMREADAS